MAETNESWSGEAQKAADELHRKMLIYIRRFERAEMSKNDGKGYFKPTLDKYPERKKLVRWLDMLDTPEDVNESEMELPGKYPYTRAYMPLDTGVDYGL